MVAIREKCLYQLRTALGGGSCQFGWTIEPIGSYATGFGTDISDLDVTCCNDIYNGNTKMAKQHLRHFILPLLKTCSGFEVVEEVLSANVPIVRLLFDQELEVDLSCYNTPALKNTRLLKAYSNIHHAVRELVIEIKRWAKKNDFGDGSKHTLNSYTITLLAIFSLQMHPEVKLPCLPVYAFEDGGMLEKDPHVVAAKSNWHYPAYTSFSHLRDFFFAFYSGQEPLSFEWGKEVISVAHGTRMYALPTFVHLPWIHFPRLHIQDPYEYYRNLNCSISYRHECRLRDTFLREFAEAQMNPLWYSPTSTLLCYALPGPFSAGCDLTDVGAEHARLLTPVSTINCHEFLYASDSGEEAPHACPCLETEEVDLECSRLIKELYNVRIKFSEALKPFKKERKPNRMLTTSMLNARTMVWDTCKKTEVFFQGKIDDSTQHSKNWGTNFQQLYVEFCYTLSMAPDPRLDQFKPFKKYLCEQRAKIWNCGYTDPATTLQEEH